MKSERDGEPLFRLDYPIEFDASAGDSTPANTDLDFDNVLRKESGPLVDPHTIVVKRKLYGR
jgi:hypothetical protein